VAQAVQRHKAPSRCGSRHPASLRASGLVLCVRAIVCAACGGMEAREAARFVCALWLAVRQQAPGRVYKGQAEHPKDAIRPPALPLPSLAPRFSRPLLELEATPLRATPPPTTQTTTLGGYPHRRLRLRLGDPGYTRRQYSLFLQLAVRAAVWCAKPAFKRIAMAATKSARTRQDKTGPA
jgi:hypothetical protein